MRFSMSQFALLGVLCAATQTTLAANNEKPQGNLRKLQSSTQVPFGFQSGPDPGPSYGGSVVYRPDSHRIYVTGSTYGNYFKSVNVADANSNQASQQSSCFLGIAEIPSADNAETPMTWIHAQQWETTAPEACNVIQVDSNPINLPENNTDIQEKMYLLGYTATNGLMENLRLESTFPAQQYGMIMDVDVVNQPDGTSPISTTFWGGRILQDGPVQYPIDMTLDDDGNIYVVSLQTYDSNPSTVKSNPNQVAKQMVNPWLTPFGNEYNMLVEQFLYDNPGYDDGKGLPADPSNVPIDTTIVDNWRKPYGPKGSGSAIVSGVAYLGGLLVVVGSTNGHSEVFGNEITTNSINPDTSMDGFITKLIPESGSYYQFVVDNGAPDIAQESQPAHKRSATTIESIDSKDDFIMGMCSSPADPDNFYVVGTTEGQMEKEVNMLVEGEIHAFIAKINLWTLLPVWRKQVGGNAVNKDVVRGMACAVTADAQDVYMAGIVEDGASLSLYNQESFGKDDIFLLQTKAEDGQLQFLRQIGTSGSDRLSTGGLTTDEFGNAILMGHTEGSFFRSRQFDQDSEKTDDLFIMTVMRDTGDYKEPEVDTVTETTPTVTDTVIESPPIDLPAEEEPVAVTPAPTEPAPVQETPVQEPVADDTPVQETPIEETPTEEEQAPATFKPIGKEPEIYTNSGAVSLDDFENLNHQDNLKNNDTPPSKENAQRYGLVIFFVLVALVSVVTGIFAYKQMSRGEAVTDRDNVMGYLNDFDDEDIDLKKSATGGYHCSYTNDLAHGVNARAVSREGLFGPMGYSDNAGSHQDPLLALHPSDRREGGEIHFSEERGDDVSSIGSGIATGRNSTHNALLDDYDGQVTKDLIF